MINQFGKVYRRTRMPPETLRLLNAAVKAEHVDDRLKKLLRRVAYASRNRRTWHIPFDVRVQAKNLLKEIYG